MPPWYAKRWAVTARALRLANQRLAFAGTPASLREVPDALRPRYHHKPVLDLVMGAQLGDFSGTSLYQAFNTDWTLDSRADHGHPLAGAAAGLPGRADDFRGIPLGAVQVPPDGQPIVLLNDRQTIGGYPRLGR